MPAMPHRLEETGLPPEFLEDLILKTIRTSSRLSGSRIAERLALSPTVVGPLLRNLRQQGYLEVPSSAGGAIELGFEHALTAPGRARAAEALEVSGYVGPAPVTLEEYTAVIGAQGGAVRATIEPRDVDEVLSHLVLPREVREAVGAALTVGRIMLLYGEPGNGKTVIAEALGRLPGTVLVPHALLVDADAVVQVFDPRCHHPIESELPRRYDRRWTICRPPFVAVGGELTLAQLDLVWDARARIYQASLPMRAAGGWLLVDDFGRQAEPPWAFLNRWIVPLEKGVDYLSLRTGRTIEVPFDAYVILSTNLALQDFGDEAFMRRLASKIHVPDPDPADFVVILRRVCASHGVTYSPEGARHLIETYYWDPERRAFRRPMRACHPRDIIRHLTSLAAQRGRRPALERDLIDAACRAVFTAGPHHPG